ncbi:MAG: sensor histidine kinase [Nocardioides sp.]
MPDASSVGGSVLRVLRALTAIQALSAGICLVYTASVERAALTAAPATIAVLVVAPWALGLLGLLVVPSRSSALLRHFNVVGALWFVFSILAIVVGTALGVWPAIEPPWLLVQSIAVAAAFAATGSGVLGAAVTTVTVLCGIEALRALDRGLTIPGFIDDAHLIFFGLMTATFAEFVAAARRHDEAARRAVEAVAASAAASAGRAAREQMEALVHDEVFTALLLGSQRLPEAAGPQATRALDLIGRAQSPESPDRTVTEAVFLEQLDRTIRTTAPTVFVHRDLEGAPALPAYVASALIDAVAQALANTAKHAPSAQVDLKVSTTADGLRIQVIDNGPGFHPPSVSHQRMGIAVSILGRVNALPGASARVVSQRGRGTVVTLAWLASPDRTPLAQPVAGVGRRMLRDIRIGIAFFLLGQAVLGVLALANGARPDVVAVAYLGIAGGMLVLDWRHLGRPTPVRTAVAVGCCWLVGSLGWAPAPHNGEAAGWYLIGMGILASVLAIRARPASAVLAVAGGVGLGTMGLLARGATVLPNNATFITPVLAVVWTLVCVSAWRVLQTRTARLGAEELVDLDHRAAERARQETLAANVRAVTRLVAPTLTTLASATEIPPELARECRALEGHLRDDFRGGRLADPPLVAAAREARLRGVDVVLLDDGPDRELPEVILDGLRRWMAEALAAAEGRFTGRILPSGREPIATAVTPDLALVYEL